MWLHLTKEYALKITVKKEWEEGDRVSYAGRVYDQEELGIKLFNHCFFFSFFDFQGLFIKYLLSSEGGKIHCNG